MFRSDSTKMRRTSQVALAVAVVLGLCVAVASGNPGLSDRSTSARATPTGQSDPGQQAPPDHPAMASRPTPYLPFDLPVGATKKKVFAHYVPWLPISIDNRSAGEDYYTTQLMPPNGENGTHAPYGGYLRDRPLPRPPLDGSDWRDVDVQTEVSQAKSIGIDGFAVDILMPAASPDAPLRVFRAAQSAGDFSIQVTPDMSGSFGTDFTEAAFADGIAPYLEQAAAQRLDDGRVVLGAFFAERKPVTWWRNVLDILRVGHRLDVAFVPTFLDASTAMDSFAPISDGFSNWGTRNPVSLSATNDHPNSPVALVRRAHALGKLWMQPVPYQDNRPSQGTFEESQNGVTNRNAWGIAHDEDAEWVNIITWNDYAESTAVAPSQQHGWRLLDRDAYHVARFEYGSYPPVVRDALFVSHRVQPFGAVPKYPETVLMANVGDTPPRDSIEVESYATAPSVVVVVVGGVRQTCDVPAGFAQCTFPLGFGQIVATLTRGGVDEVVVRSPYLVTDQPYVQDLQYVVAGGLR